MKTPGVSVVIPTYNRLDTLRRLLESIACQTHRVSEVIVVDDNSPVGEKIKALLESFKGRLPRMKYLRNLANRGPSHSRNRGILAARYPLIALSDDDDEWMPGKLKAKMDYFTRHWGQTEMVFTWVLVKNERGQTVWKFKPFLRGNDVRKFLSDISGALPNPSATLIKREALLRAGLFDESLTGTDDWDLWLRMQKTGARCQAVKQYLTLQHQQNVRLSISFSGRFGFIRFAVKHFWFILKNNPVIFFHLAWFATGIKLGLRKKLGKYIGIKNAG